MKPRNSDLFAAVVRYNNARAMCSSTNKRIYYGRANGLDVTILTSELPAMLSRCGTAKRRLVAEIRKVEQHLGRKPRAFK